MLTHFTWKTWQTVDAVAFALDQVRSFTDDWVRCDPLEPCWTQVTGFMPVDLILRDPISFTIKALMVCWYVKQVIGCWSFYLLCGASLVSQ